MLHMFSSNVKSKHKLSHLVINNGLANVSPVRLKKNLISFKLLLSLLKMRYFWASVVNVEEQYDHDHYGKGCI